MWNSRGSAGESEQQTCYNFKDARFERQTFCGSLVPRQETQSGVQSDSLSQECTVQELPAAPGSRPTATAATAGFEALCVSCTCLTSRYQRIRMC